ncbi:QcrA and Rieske domain-containing protein [Alienimonas californiensis]|uniref:Cytochrome b6-f complex iron-sulfur subunit n=1 Tax=Alienimonas californiensis TaxID=2527989 RepID=A0A517P920_9PLAN|nr:Rieske 2Fe-2S domain-containing protein [Alienimonas californiensis]QDT15862.1 Cytochrome b6-f complex iron-sulfur subunit [Alienimonas californiensis]
MTDSATAPPAPRTGRRNWLAWAARGLYAACAAAVAWPMARFFTAPLAAEAAGPVRDRAVRLADLKPGVPRLVPITGESVDAWTRHPAVTVGRAWVVRTSPADVAPPDVEVNAFSSVCPHAGCQVSGTVQTRPNAGAEGLICPCHGAVFALDGERRPKLDGGANPSPRGLDSLDTALVQDDDGLWWVEIEYKRFELGTADGSVA